MKRETARGGSSARNIKRRTFIKAGAAAVAGAATLPGASLAAEPAATVVVVHGTDIAKVVEAGIAKLGGWDKFFKPGGKVALKPHLAWKSTPEQGGNTHPDILRAVVLAAVDPEETAEAGEAAWGHGPLLGRHGAGTGVDFCGGHGLFSCLFGLQLRSFAGLVQMIAERIPQ